MDKVNLAQKLGLIREHWTPKIVAELNGQEVKLVKLRGEFVWHHHEREDELFLVLKGRLLFEPSSTLNTGNVVDERTVFEPERI